MEHLACPSPLSLKAFCELASRTLGLPEFEYDYENETEWGISFKDGVEYNISRPYEAGTLENWDPSVPSGSNFGIALIFRSAEIDPVFDTTNLVEDVGQSLANALDCIVIHHRTWLGVGRNLARASNFVPQPERLPP